MARRCRERDSCLDTSDQAWIYWGKEEDDVLGVHRFGFAVSCNRKTLFSLVSQTWAEQLSHAYLQLHTR